MKGIDTKHKEYTQFIEQWNKCRTVAAGSEEIKNRGAEFLPMLEEQSGEQYEKYKMRALFFEATMRTITGLLGMLFAKEPAITQPDSKSLLDNLTLSHSNIKTFLKHCAKEVITVGRHCILVDVNMQGMPFLTSYAAENVINWREGEINGEKKLLLVVLREQKPMPKGNFETTMVEQYRVLALDEMGNYVQQVYEKEDKTDQFKQIGEDVYPQKGGNKLTEIPFYFISAGGMGTATERPPLLGLVNVNISHYMNSADLEHGRHFTGLPTPWAAGFATTGAALTIGSQKAWVTSKTDAKAGYLEFTGQGLSTLENALKEKQDMMIVLGARLLEAPKLASESADNQASRKQGEFGILANIADAVGDVVTTAVKFAVDWGKGNPEDYALELNKEFTIFEANPALMLALMQQVQGGLMSFDIYFYNMKKAGMYPDSTTVDDEQGKIDLANPMEPGETSRDDDGM